MAYQQLDSNSVIDYLRNVPEMRTLFSSFDHLQASEIGDGNVNFVYRVENLNQPEESVIVKQAVPYLRVAGDSWPLSLERVHYETMALQTTRALAPEHVPEVYHSSREMALIIMQNLSEHKILRTEIIAGKTFPQFGRQIAIYLADTLFYSSDLYLSSADKKEAVGRFVNNELCKITEDLVFTHPFEDNDTNEYNPELSAATIANIQTNPAVKIAVAQMRHKFMTQAEALLHGDLHTGSIMVNQTDTYVIDPEFAFYGPMGFDLGALIANFFLAYFAHGYWCQQEVGVSANHRAWLLDAIGEIWVTFVKKFEQNWIQQHQQNLAWCYDDGQIHFQALRKTEMRRLLSDTIGFAACKMMRRIVGLAKVAEITSIEDLSARAAIEATVLKFASHIIVERENILSIEQLIELARTLSQQIDLSRSSAAFEKEP